MRITLATLLGVVAASPALAASGPFFSLGNTDFVVLIAFLIFVGVLFYFKVPGMLGGLLDKRAAEIKSELDEARSLREEAQTLLASYERQQSQVKEQAERIVEHAREDARMAAEAAKADLQQSIARRLSAAEDQITSAEAAAVKEVRDQAITIAVAVARDEIAAQMTAKEANALIDGAIEEVGAKLH